LLSLRSSRPSLLALPHLINVLPALGESLVVKDCKLRVTEDCGRVLEEGGVSEQSTNGKTKLVEDGRLWMPRLGYKLKNARG